MTCKAIWIALGGAVGWLVGEFNPAFPLIIVAIAFILNDAWTDYVCGNMFSAGLAVAVTLMDAIWGDCR